jgi:membrane-bound lytic murein transglycosylase D
VDGGSCLKSLFAGSVVFLMGLFVLVSPVRAEESSLCIEESTEKNYADAAVKCAQAPWSFTESIFSSGSSPLDEDTPVTHTQIAGDKKLTAARPWRAPDFSGQEKSLGYKAAGFTTPKGMEKQVQFWIDIYTKYTTEQGVIHDAENIDLIYETVDFRDINSNGGINIFVKEKQKQRMVEDMKKKVAATLAKLATVTDPKTLNEKELKIWKALEKDNEPNKFKEAAQKNRLRFQLGQKDRMVDAIYFSGRYLEDMEKIFHDAGLPIELTRLAFVESSFNVLARSKVGASGLFQIMPYTAKPYKMINPSIDKRNQPLEATKLAAKLLRNNFNMLEDWPLAVTGWNHGPSGVRKMTLSYKTRDLADLVENVRSRKSFGFASRNFYASFLAALTVEQNASKYFDKVTWSQPLRSLEIKLPVAIKYKELLAWFGGDDEKTEVFNPHITRQVRRFGRPIPAKSVVFVPQERYNTVLISLSKKDRRPMSAEEPETPETYTVSSGDTLTSIAHDMGIKLHDLIKANELESVHSIKPGQTLQIPR